VISKPWQVVMFLFAAAALNYADRTALSSVIPPLRSDLGVTDAQIGLIGMLFLWSYALSSPFAGVVADRFSRSRIIVWSLVAWSLVTVLTGFSTSMMMLLVLRVALGIAESLYLPAAGALIAEHHAAGTRGRAMGYHMMGLNVGLVVGGTSAGLLAEHFGWRWGFWILGGLGLILALAARHMLEDGPVRTTEAKTRGNLRLALAYLIRVPSFHCLLFSGMVAGVASWIFLTWLPLFFTENYGMKLGAAGLAGVALYKGPVFLGIAIGGWLSDRAIRRDSRSRVLIKGLSFLVSAPLLFFFIGAPSLLVIAVVMVLSSMIRAIGLPSEHAILCEIVPPAFRSTAIGLLNTCWTAAGGIGVLLAGLFKQDVGLEVIFGSSSFLYILAGLLMLLSYWFYVSKDMARAETYAAASDLATEPRSNPA
jgi:MFS transporter, Spinster family, sphingosine-1-phosphate transporter